MRKKTIDTIPILTGKMHDILNRFSKSRTLPASLVKRSQIILMSAEGETNQKIAVKVGLHYDNVATWRTRFLANLPKLIELEASVPEKLPDETVRILSDKKRPGVPSKFTQEQIMRIINLACKHPQEYGYEVSQWSLTLLVKEIIKSGIADRISEKTVSRFLK
jgi:transposase